jgi:methyl-accepting chemotaxis protein
MTSVETGGASRSLVASMRRALVALALVPTGIAAAAACAAWLLADAAGDVLVWPTLVVGLFVLFVVSVLASAAVAARLSSRLSEPLDTIRDTVARLSAGDFAARTGLGPGDELGALGRSIDTLLDERVSGLERTARESEELNDSVIEIMQAVGTIATSKDLTLRVPVTENVTGAIADALNLLTDETRRVLLNVREVSQDVAQATMAVKSQSDAAGRAAAREQREVDLAARELGAAAATLNAIAERARSCNEVAERAVLTSGEAMRSVGTTVQGVTQSRTLIRETEKRIKRLGERSQEIGQVVGIIQGIAERTGILALNASMRAAAAGEAGRSFAVVADEVKRLSESAREATSQIGRLITAIQVETNDTVIAMNQAIAQVVEISRLAEEAGSGMRRTQSETEELAGSVRDIARTSSEQAKIGAALQERARIIQEASGETARQLSMQADETMRLVQSARALLDQVGVFRVED